MDDSVFVVIRARMLSYFDRICDNLWNKSYYIYFLSENEKDFRFIVTSFVVIKKEGRNGVQKKKKKRNGVPC